MTGENPSKSLCFQTKMQKFGRGLKGKMQVQELFSIFFFFSKITVNHVIRCLCENPSKSLCFQTKMQKFGRGHKGKMQG